MNTPDNNQSVLVWDFPVRVFHWLLVISFAGAWLTSESEAQQMFHYAFGYSTVFLILFRLFWGFFGTKYARFSQFVKGPAEIFAHIKLLSSGNKHHGLGHNPAGALAIVALMGMVLLIGVTGFLTVKEFFGDAMSDAHEALANLALGVVAIHVAAALIMSFMQKENLILSMVTGKKQGGSGDGIKFPGYFIGLSLALLGMVFFYMVISGTFSFLTQ